MRDMVFATAGFVSASQAVAIVQFPSSMLQRQPAPIATRLEEG